MGGDGPGATAGLVDVTTTALLLSGGIDSAAVAAWKHPDIALFIDYGQRSASAERRAARAVAAELEIRHHELTVGLDALGAGVLKDDVTRDGWPSPEWWPYRNQLLVTCAAAWLTTNAEILEIKMPPQARILMGTVSSDASRHRDGSFRFFEALNALLASQEGFIGVDVPAIEMSTQQLILVSHITDSVMGWTHSCHTANLPCGRCPGCHKREQVLRDVNRLN